MAKCKVYLFTYNRNLLLKRAIESLINQSFTDWICELHNDNPNDKFPEQYIIGLNDSRFFVINHVQNLGPIKSFNLAFEPCKEEFISLLEDDNWLESTYLEEMVNSLRKFNAIQVAFSNHYLWEEAENNQWNKLSELKYPLGKEYELINYPDFEHVYKYHFSNCTVFFRNNDSIVNYQIPQQTRGDFMEHVREKSFPHPILFVNKPLANFSLTFDTYRSKSILGFHEHNSLLIAAFFRHNTVSVSWINELLRDARNGFGFSINKFIYASLIDAKSRKLILNFGISDWLIFLMYNLKHPLIFFRVLNAKKNYNNLWKYLDSKTQVLASNRKNF